MSQPANGYVPASALVQVQAGTFLGHSYTIDLETATAAAFKKAQAAGALTISPDLGGYRSEPQQLDLHNHPAAHGSNLRPAQIKASGSTHGWGTCVDIAAGNAWFQTHCGEYGFVRESPAGESNHYRFLHPTWAPAVVLTVKQRLAVVLTDGFTGPGTNFPRSGSPLQPGAIGNFTAFCHSPASLGGVVGDTDVWYLGTSGRWFSAIGFNIVDGTALTDLTAQFASPSPVSTPPAKPLDVPASPGTAVSTVSVPATTPTHLPAPDPKRTPAPTDPQTEAPVVPSTLGSTSSAPWFVTLFAGIWAALTGKRS